MERTAPLLFLPWMERATVIDALTNSRNIGVQFWTTPFNRRMTIAAGVFNRWLEEGVRFKDSPTSATGRITWLPLDNRPPGSLIHLGLYGRVGEGGEKPIKVQETPEAFFTEYFVDTGKFSLDRATHLGVEAGWRKGSFMVGGEALMANARAPDVGDPRFSGGYINATWILTGESTPYNREFGHWGLVAPNRTVNQGGPGLIRIGVRYSWIDLNGGTIQGGEMSRLSAGVTWLPTPTTRADFNYGMVKLNRFGIIGTTHIFQWRIMLMF